MNFSLALAAARGPSGSRMLDGASRRERASRNSMEAVIFRLGAGRRNRRPFYQRFTRVRACDRVGNLKRPSVRTSISKPQGVGQSSTHTGQPAN